MEQRLLESKREMHAEKTIRAKIVLFYVSLRAIPVQDVLKGKYGRKLRHKEHMSADGKREGKMPK